VEFHVVIENVIALLHELPRNCVELLFQSLPLLIEVLQGLLEEFMMPFSTLAPLPHSVPHSV